MIRNALLITLPAAVLAATSCSPVAAGEFPQFTPRVIDPHCGEVCYAVTVADVNDDGKTDIVAVTENRVLWYENPSWEPRVIIEDQTERDNVCIAPYDIDGDGKVDFALGAGWTKIGTIQWLSRGESLKDRWQVHLIGEERWLHRMRFADVLGKGKAQLVISPLNKTRGNGVRLTAFEIPEDPKTGRWRRTLLDGGLDRMHNHWHADLNGDGLIDTLTASREGVHLIHRSGDGFQRTKIGTGATGEGPNDSGAGEIKLGTMKNSTRYIATIEPMHGNRIAVYTEPDSGGGLWNRQVIEDSLVRGHALWPADLDGDGDQELVVGHSNTAGGDDKPRGVYVYDATDASGKTWRKHVIDEGGVAVEDAITADFNGDGRIDIVAGGRYTHNIKLYVNTGAR